MNERLEDLMYSAGLTASGCWDQMDEYDHAAIEKFAKLLIIACSEVAVNCRTGSTAADMIEKHFEVTR
jgi:hypothetical protein